MDSERLPESPVRMFRRYDTVRVEMVDVAETDSGWTGHLFRPVTIGGVRWNRGTARTCSKKNWQELTPAAGG